MDQQKIKKTGQSALLVNKWRKNWNTEYTIYTYYNGDTWRNL